MNKPRLLFLVDSMTWSFANSAKVISRLLSDEFNIVIKDVESGPLFNAASYDLIYVFFWGEKYQQRFKFTYKQTIKEISSHKWQFEKKYGPCTAEEMLRQYANDAGTLICTTKRLLDMFTSLHSRVFLTPNGIDSNAFNIQESRHGDITQGWAGDINDTTKGLQDIIPEIQKHYSFVIAGGGIPHGEMNCFYNKLDLFVIAAAHDGEPLTLLESMAAGCFPIMSDIGLAREIINHKINGYIVESRTANDFLKAIEWCKNNIDYIRTSREQRSKELIQQRDWTKTIGAFRDVFNSTLKYKNE